jgi:NADH-quinone oxidoreductase subunit F
LLKILNKLTDGTASKDDLNAMHRLVRTLTDASFCGLGQSAAAALSTAWKHFQAEFEGALYE